MNFSKPPVVGRVRVHRAVVDGLGVWEDDNHLIRAASECAFDGLREVDFLRPLIGSDGVAMQRVTTGERRFLCFAYPGGRKTITSRSTASPARFPSKESPRTLMRSTVTAFAPDTASGKLVCTWAVSRVTGAAATAGAITYATG